LQQLRNKLAQFPRIGPVSDNEVFPIDETIGADRKAGLVNSMAKARARTSLSFMATPLLNTD